MTDTTPTGPDPEATAAVLDRCAQTLREAVDGRDMPGLDARDVGYVEGWDAAARYFAASFAAAALEIRDASS